MKKTILIIFICLTILLIIAVCSWRKNIREEGIPSEKDSSDIVFTISKKRNDCIPFNLVVYNDGSYELFTAYKSCKKDEVCAAILKYSKSIKGKYDFDVMKIIDNSINANDIENTNDDLIDYEIYMGNSYIEKGYSNLYIIKKGKINKYLDEFLNEINVNLNECAQSEYIDK